MDNAGSSKLLILAVIAAVAIIGGAVMYVRGANAPQTPPAPTAQFEGDHLVIEEAMQTCAQGQRCIVVDSHCGFCCKFIAINAAHEATFNKVFDKNCGRYSGEFCQCYDLSSYPSCVQGKCQLVKWPEEKKTAVSPRPQAQIPQPAPEIQPEPVSEPQPQPEPEPQTPAPAPVEMPVTAPPAAEPIATPAPEPQPEPKSAPEEPAGFLPEEEPPPNDSLYAPLPSANPMDDPAYRDINRPAPSDDLNAPLEPGQPQP